MSMKITNKKNIGIITYYHNSINYGGNLQAYALCKKLNAMGANAEQICFDANETAIVFRKILRFFKNKIRAKTNIQNKKVNEFNRELVKKRLEAFENFNKKLIPHSDKVYNRKTICQANKNYDCFVAGSDQVWNPQWFVGAYFLDFVAEEKFKVSYATSFGTTEFSEDCKKKIKEKVKDFDMISLREHSCLIEQDVFPFMPEILIDPTLLLERQDWENIAQAPQLKDKYVFCYFFGDNKKSRQLANDYAQNHGYKVIAISHLNGFNSADDFVESLTYASPEQFLGLIKNSECVFTDSFHAVVFSNIFNKNYFVFKRSEKDNMSSRIFSITELFNSGERFCCTEQRLCKEYIESLDDIDYSYKNEKVENLKNKSIDFLKQVIKKIN